MPATGQVRPVATVSYRALPTDGTGDGLARLNPLVAQQNCQRARAAIASPLDVRVAPRVGAPLCPVLVRRTVLHIAVLGDSLTHR
jgi:hypothetical protein